MFRKSLTYSCVSVVSVTSRPTRTNPTFAVGHQRLHHRYCGETNYSLDSPMVLIFECAMSISPCGRQRNVRTRPSTFTPNAGWQDRSAAVCTCFVHALPHLPIWTRWSWPTHTCHHVNLLAMHLRHDYDSLCLTRSVVLPPCFLDVVSRPTERRCVHQKKKKTHGDRERCRWIVASACLIRVRS